MGYDSFGLKIGIEGEKNFKNALKEINQSFKVLGARKFLSRPAQNMYRQTVSLNILFLLKKHH
jgi:hypothetical protein